MILTHLVMFGFLGGAGTAAVAPEDEEIVFEETFAIETIMEAGMGDSSIAKRATGGPSIVEAGMTA